MKSSPRRIVVDEAVSDSEWRLMLHSVKTRIYYDAVRIDAGQARAREACQDLAACFEELEFVPTPKGPLIERLRRKLEVLARGNSNEILEGDVTEIITRLAARRSQAP